MPSLHCHLPPDEEQNKMPGTEDPMPEMEDSDESNEPEEITAEMEDTEETEEAEEMEESSEENDDTDGSTSDEALSLINDTSVVPWVPEINSSDEGRERLSTTVDDDTEPMEFSTTVGHVRQSSSRNVARRSRARCPGVNFVRRGRHRQPLSQQELDPVRPFDRGVTFNGFNRNLEPRRVHGYFHDVASDEILYRVSWRNHGDRMARPIEASLMRTFRPEMIVEFYEELVTRNRFLNLHNR